jgi:type II secretory pathway pseudopilin PulG
MIFIKKINLRQRGDTIVEVLIAMAVLGMVLGTAFAIANRSYAVGISAQERTEAVKIAESQIELLRLGSEVTGSDILEPVNANELFCVDPNASGLSRAVYSGTVEEITGPVDPIAYDPACTFGTDDRYKVSIEQTGANDEIYSIRVRWESVLGGFIEEVEHVYRTYDFEGSYSLIAPTIISTTCDDAGALNPGQPLPCRFPASVNVVVRKIPPAPGNNTPNCSQPATSNQSGTRVNLNGSNENTNTTSTAIFSGLEANTVLPVSITSVPAGHQLCPGGPTTITTGAEGSNVTNSAFKIRPVCTLTQTGTIPGYYTRGARRTDADGLYYTLNTDNVYIVPWISPPGGLYKFVQVGSSFTWWDGRQVANYRGYNAVYISATPIFSRTCP